MTTETTTVVTSTPVPGPLAPPAAAVDASGRPVLVQVRDLKKYFPIRRGKKK